MDFHVHYLGVLESLIMNLKSKISISKYLQYGGRNCKKILDFDIN